MEENKYVAFYADGYEYEEFETFEEAEQWLIDYDTQDGYSQETELGKNWIAKITHRSKVVNGFPEYEKIKTCKWTNHESYNVWETSCSDNFQLYTGTPKENKFKYCPYCGGEIE